ncbi:MAG: HD domain-containing phosphohydrolase [Dehalococcoidia bacterium]
MSDNHKVKPIELIGQFSKYFLILYVSLFVVVGIILALLYFWVLASLTPDVLKNVTALLFNKLFILLLIMLIPTIIAAYSLAGTGAKYKKLEEQLKLHTHLLDIVSDSVFIHDLMGNCIYANDMASRSRGYSKKELQKMKYMELTTPERAGLIQSRIDELAEKGELTFESVHLNKHKSLMSVEIHSRLIKSGSRSLIISATRDITEQKLTEEELKQSAEKLRKAMEGTIHAIGLTTEMKDPYTAGHQTRVAKLACAIASELGFSQDRIEGVRVAGSLHDIGKISIPSEILSKPGRLKATEFNLIKDHAQVGYDILNTVEFPWPVAQIVVQHHERMDGSGYPQGIRGSNILLEAAIMAVADVVEAMSSHRPYRPAFSVEKALLEIIQKKGVLYHPEVVDVCLNLFNEKGFKFEQ